MNLFVLMLVCFVGFTGSQDESGAPDVAKESDLLRLLGEIGLLKNELQEAKTELKNELQQVKSEMQAKAEDNAKECGSVNIKLDSVIEMLKKLTKGPSGIELLSATYELRYFYFISSLTYSHLL